MLGRLLSGKAIGTDELVVRDTKFLDADENIDWEKWAPNGGRVPGTIKENQTIPAGTIIDRYGSQWGKYTSPAGVPYEQRALPYIENPNAYHKYEVLKKLQLAEPVSAHSAIDIRCICRCGRLKFREAEYPCQHALLRLAHARHIWNGNRQVKCEICAALQHATEPRVLLSGGRKSGTRR